MKSININIKLIINYKINSELFYYFEKELIYP